MANSVSTTGKCDTLPRLLLTNDAIDRCHVTCGAAFGPERKHHYVNRNQTNWKMMQCNWMNTNISENNFSREINDMQHVRSRDYSWWKQTFVNWVDRFIPSSTGFNLYWSYFLYLIGSGSAGDRWFMKSPVSHVLTMPDFTKQVLQISSHAPFYTHLDQLLEPGPKVDIL